MSSPADEVDPNQGDLFDAIAAAAEGRRLRDEGIELTTSTASSSDIDTLDELIDRAIAGGLPFSANSFRQEMQDAQIKSSLIGARFRSYMTRRLIERIGDTPSTDPGTHAHRIGLYVGTEVGVDSPAGAA